MSNLDDAMGVRPLSEVEETTELVVFDKTTGTIDDVDYVRENMHGIIAHGGDAMRELLAIAKQTDSPAAFTALATMFKTMVDANKTYLDVAVKKDELLNTDGNGGGNGPATVNNNVILSTDDFLDRLLVARQNEKDNKTED